MKKVLFIICLLAISFVNAVDQQLAHQFETLVQQSPGVLTDFPEEVREIRKGPVVQKVVFRGQDEMTIELSFPCRRENGTTGEAHFCHTVSLSRIAADQTSVLLNEHLNSITFKDAQLPCSLAFHDLHKACRAKEILDQLIAQAIPGQEAPTFKPSLVAQKTGYTYLVVAPRNESLRGAVKGLCTNATSAQNVVWLTKKPLDDVEGIIHEGCNCLPLFIYDISLLDQASFYTTSIGRGTSLTYVTFERTLQSVFSKEEEALRTFFSSTSSAGILFKEDPGFKQPSCIFCKASDKKTIQKICAELHIKEPAVACSSGLAPSNNTPLGTTLYWLSGINNNSYEALAYCFQNEQFSSTLFSGILYREFPHLRTLLKGSSRYARNLTREQAISRSLQRLATLKSSVRADLYTVLQVALFSCELGAPFGGDSDIGYNSWPFAQTIAEKIGLSAIQEQMVEWLIQENSSLVIDTHKKNPSVGKAWVELAKKAGTLRIPAEDLLILQKTFITALLNGNCSHSPSMTLLKQVQASFTNLLCFGLPFGLTVFQGPYPVRTMYSTYIWELRDPKHRDGLALSWKRAKYETTILQGSKSACKGSFWNWLDRTTTLPSTTYISTEKRENYRAVFEQGRLVHPAEFSSLDHTELLFVIDDCGQIYVGHKEDATDIKHHNFNHASLLSGGAVASAGKLIIEQGKPVEIVDHSGHYRPSGEQIRIAVQCFAKQGVEIEHLAIHMTFLNKRWSSGADFLHDMELYSDNP